ncbi:(R,R)-butanediol dehydrogenase/meso-butanediol dehydrogenase/diacetyl reductase [Tamaricihabitans halophyticus]|uniref:(R,R)-butanediol dehydrogenase/meso-butanediol dehydrogenase/diacetyl reductase n=1 Tax=Tamaricihabitans halophyticus TaxID=1262583 RepID=A0A4R2QXZ4_9PSEU|nr:2,3-butanediol dehydrogenase [Tamaricihabitans halophyticus]TCP54039.1 (R,R)-butanediol dehydrogenase/meso-butanediol dehydrogenase/diacetyl reductase [Tamaricihabitans halophyticus]
MRAVVYHDRERVAIEDVAEPACGQDQVKIAVAHNGICGTDLHEYFAGPIFIPTEPHVLTGQRLPMVLGHEFAGTVTEVGADVRAVAPGDRVAVEPVYRCGSCPPCRSGHYNICQHIGFHGLMAAGGMSEFTVVPEYMVHPLPEGVSLELGALVEPMSVAYHAARLGEVGAGDTAVVFGAGPIGIGTWFALRGLGVADVLVFEPAAERRAALAQLGATVLDPTEVDPGAYVREHTAGRGAHAVYDAAGVRASVESGLDCLAARRNLVAVAIYEQPFEVTLLKLVMNESGVRGSLCYTSDDYRAVLELMARGHYDTSGWVTHIGLDSVVSDGFEALHAGRRMKVLVDP